jgi:hypothetical protein
VTSIDLGRINVDVRNYAYAGHAVVISQNNFYGVSNYRNVQVANVSTTTIINNYHAAPVVNNTVVNNYSNMKQKYGYANVTVDEKPHASVLNRIQQNEKIIHEGGKVNAAALGQQVKNIRQGSINQGARVQQPKVTNYIVPAADVNRPKSEVAFQQREVKTAGKGAGVRPGPQGRPVPGQPARPAGSASKPPGPPPAPQASKPEGAPPRVQTVGQPSPKPQGTAPARPGQGAPPKPPKPAKPGEAKGEKKPQEAKQKEKQEKPQ